MISELFQLLSAISCSAAGKLSHGNLGIGRFCWLRPKDTSNVDASPDCVLSLTSGAVLT